MSPTCGACSRARRPPGPLLRSAVTTGPSFVPVDVRFLPRPPDEAIRRSLFVALDQATRWVSVAVLPQKSTAYVQGFLERRLAISPCKTAKAFCGRSGAHWPLLGYQ